MALGPKEIGDAIAGDDPVLRALVRVDLLQGELGIGSVIADIIKHPDQQWSMVIKLNALFEAALTHVLTQAFGHPPLERQFGEMSHAKRIAFASDAGVIDADQRRFMVTLNGLRNAFAHDVRNLDRTISDYVASLPGDAKREQFRAGINPAPPSLGKLASDAPQTMILVGALLTLSRLYDTKADRVSRREEDREAAAAFRALSSTAATFLKEAGIELSPPTTNSSEDHSDQ